MFGVTWDTRNPPVEPPPGCLDAQRWRSSRLLYDAHQLEDVGAHCVCGDVWPCADHRRALRGLLTTCLQAGAIKVAPADLYAGAVSCCWCGRRIVRHQARGWVHAFDGMIVCRTSIDKADSFTRAERAG